MVKQGLALLTLLYSLTVAAGEIYSWNIMYETAKEYPEYMHYKVIGACTWVKYRSFPRPPSFAVTLELDYFSPDLVVSVFNKNGDNPWTEANTMLDKGTNKAGSLLIEKLYKVPLGDGNIQAKSDKISHVGIRRKVVDVIGHPNALFGFPFATLTSDVTPFFPYYQSDLDVAGRMGIAEKIRPQTYSAVTNFIGSPMNHWSFEFPREMSAIINNDYKAALVFAHRAADLVTNYNTMHTVVSVNNSCGINCVVSNVVYDPTEKKIRWQEIYPKNRRIKMGEPDTSANSMGNADYNKGEGNYVFVVWRRYQGCVQASGYKKLYSKTKSFKPTVKR